MPWTVESCCTLCSFKISSLGLFSAQWSVSLQGLQGISCHQPVPCHLMASGLVGWIMWCVELLPFVLVAVIEIDAVGVYTVSRIVYDLWMKVHNVNHTINHTQFSVIGAWRKHCKYFSHTLLYWHSFAGISRRCGCCCFITFIFRYMLVLLKPQ